MKRRVPDRDKTFRAGPPNRNGPEDGVPVIQPPSSAQVELERRPVLYLPDGRVLVRAIGFRTDK